MSVLWTIVLGLLLVRVALTIRKAVPFDKEATLSLRGVAMSAVVLGHIYARVPIVGRWYVDLSICACKDQRCLWPLDERRSDKMERTS